MSTFRVAVVEEGTEMVMRGNGEVGEGVGVGKIHEGPQKRVLRRVLSAMPGTSQLQEVRTKPRSGRRKGGSYEGLWEGRRVSPDCGYHLICKKRQV